MKLFDYQSESLKEIKKHFSNGEKAVCLSFYTGSGKTNIFLKLCEELIKDNPKVKIGISSYITTEIKNQTFERAISLGLGKQTEEVVDAEIKSEDKNIYIFNPQSLYRIPKRDKFDYLIIDESHVAMNENSLMLNRIIKDLGKNSCKLLLVTATPWDLLAQKRFQNIPVIKRSILSGLEDGRISDVEIITEENQIEFKESDYTRYGNLTLKAMKDYHAFLKSVCAGKMDNLLKKYGDSLGQKVLVICPPGNRGEIARDLAARYSGTFMVQDDRRNAVESKMNLERFKKDPKLRFLFVVYKCSVGFDMPSLSTTIDLTMSRNVKVIVQRLGRVARKYKTTPKKFIYIHDKSLTREKVDWIIGTSVDFACGNFDGWKSKNLKYRPLPVHDRSSTFTDFKRRESSKFLTDIIKQIARPGSLETSFVSKYSDGAPPKFRTLGEAIEESKKYKNRHELFKLNPSLYKWFRLNGYLRELNQIHPLLNVKGKWNERTVVEALKKCKSRTEFAEKYSGAEDWILVNKRRDLKDKHLPSKNIKRWNLELAKKYIDEKCETWSDFRIGGCRSWAQKNNKINELKEYYLKNKPLKTHCKNGHLLSGNTSKNGEYHYCKTCKTESKNRYINRQQEAKAKLGGE